MGTLYLDQKDLSVKLDGYSLALYQGGERRGTIPIKPLERIVCVGNVIIETRVFHRLTEEGVGLVFLSGKQARFAGALSGRVHNDASVRLSQFRLAQDPSFCLALSKKIVTRKLEGQDAVLAALEGAVRGDQVALREGRRRIGDALSSAKEAVLLENLRGVEGSAAAAYFPGLVRAFPESLGFAGRRKRPPKDPVNAALSLTYTLLFRELVRECLIAGLDPLIGFYHQIEFGRESLACDLVEPFRPEVDLWVWRLFHDRLITARSFSHEEEQSGCYLNKEGRKIFFEAYENWMAERLRGLLRQLVSSFVHIVSGERDGDALFDGIG